MAQLIAHDAAGVESQSQGDTPLLWSSPAIAQGCSAHAEALATIGPKANTALSTTNIARVLINAFT